MRNGWHPGLDKNKREAGDVHHLMQRMIFIKGDTLTVVFTGGVNVEMLSSDHHDMRPHESHCRVRRCEIFKKK